MIKVTKLNKNFKVNVKEPGLLNALKNVLKRRYIQKEALKNIDLEIHPGEMVGLIGANGAGKTTLVKILSGIIYPTSGSVSVLGYNPWERDDRLRSQMSLIMGQKAQVWWDLPAMDSFLLIKEIYQIPEKDFHKNLEFLSKSLAISEQLNVQVRKLSLGERMKVELIAALIHQPQVIFLDEPTIGLDIMAQKSMRKFLKDYQKKYHPIILLTSHYMDDIKELCKRVLIIKDGSLIYDGKLEKILSEFGQKRSLLAEIPPQEESNLELPSHLGKLSFPTNFQVCLTTDKDNLNEATEFLFKHFNINDLSIKEPPIEDTIQKILLSGVEN